MATNWTGANGGYRRDFHDRPTRHTTHEYAPGDRYSPWLQIRFGEGALRVAPYLPFDRITKDYYAYSVMRAYTIAGVDEQGYIVPANGILPVVGGQGSPAAFYEARPLVYAERDYSNVDFGDWPDASPAINLNAVTGTMLEAADVNAEGVVVAAAQVTDPTGAGVAGRDFVGVKAGTMPIGAVTDELLEGASRFVYKQHDPQESVTIQTMYTLAVSETNAMRYNYGQATRNAIMHRNALVGNGTVANLANVGSNTPTETLDDLPFWANQGDIDESNDTDHDMIRAGDLVATDDRGNMVRFDVRVDNWDVESATAGDIELNHRYPVAAMAAVVGRCHNRQRIAGSRPLSLVKTWHDLLSGSGTDGIEGWMRRGQEMTAAEVAGIVATNVPNATVDDAYGTLDAEAEEKFGLLIHLINL
jgi:hypothetical protein